MWCQAGVLPHSTQGLSTGPHPSSPACVKGRSLSSKHCLG